MSDIVTSIKSTSSFTFLCVKSHFAFAHACIFCSFDLVTVVLISSDLHHVCSLPLFGERSQRLAPWSFKAVAYMEQS
jgi:hypothetical protein